MFCEASWSPMKHLQYTDSQENNQWGEVNMKLVVLGGMCALVTRQKCVHNTRQEFVVMAMFLLLHVGMWQKSQQSFVRST